jgi:cyclophilin family peptidyl-prolyl cis-trans isomerase
VHRNSDTQDTAGGPLRDFVIQGGGYYLQDPVPPNTTITYSQVNTIAPIADEPGGGVTGISNLRGTIAMAKSGPNTVTSQWFINQGNNSILDSPLRSDGGFAAFGAVLGNGMTVVDAIGDLPIPTDFGFTIGSPFNELPLRNFSGNSISQIRVANTVTVSQVRVLNYLAGDYDFNGTVNQADYTVWRNTLGSTTNAAADGNGNGKVDAADYVLWRKTLGQSGGPGAGSGAGLDSFGVPEPSSGILILLVGAMLTLYRARFRRDL